MQKIASALVYSRVELLYIFKILSCYAVFLGKEPKPELDGGGGVKHQN
jgi:hypothetical protein